MDTQLRIRSGIFLIAACALIVLPADLLHAAQVSASQVEKDVGARQLVREMVRNEVSSQKGDQTYWRYREIDKGTAGNTKTYQVYETKDGNVRMLIGLNDKPLTPSQRQRQESRLRRLLNNPAQARKAAQARHHDGDKERRMLAMLPNAFLFHYDGTDGKYVRLKFKPNPDFSPPTREAQVFHHMAGEILIDPQQKRLAEINGRLISEVKFFWGLLGHLNKGGTFHVRQVDLGKGHWRLSLLEVNMHGVALFFKTIGVQENERFRDYHANPPDMTLRQAVAQIEKTSYSASTATPSSHTTTGR